MNIDDMYKRYTKDELISIFKDIENINLLHNGYVYKIINVNYSTVKKTKWFKTIQEDYVYFELYSYQTYSYVSHYLKTDSKELAYMIIHWKDDKDAFKQLNDNIDFSLDSLFEENKVKQNFDNGHKTIWEKDGIKTIWDANLYRRIYNIKNDKELSYFMLYNDELQYKLVGDNKDSGRIENHPFENFKIILPNRKKENDIFVESVHQHWDKGYYLYVLYYTIMDNGNKSHGGFMWKNINSQCPFINSYIKENAGTRFINPETEEIFE